MTEGLLTEPFDANRTATRRAGAQALAAPCFEEAFDRYCDMLYRVCLVLLRQTEDAEDAVQETFVQYLDKAPVFRDAEHEKAWLLRVAINRCRNMRRFRAMHPRAALPAHAAAPDDTAGMELLQALLALPEKYRAVLHLHYIEGYKVSEIAALLRLSEAAVKKRLQHGRAKLKEAMERSDDDA